jgi:DNA-binding response OmpR family regulator
MLKEQGINIHCPKWRTGPYRDNEEKPDLILLELWTEWMDMGLRKLKSGNNRTNSNNILTARTNIDDIVKGFNVGAVDYVKTIQILPNYSPGTNPSELKDSRDIMKARTAK